MSILFAILLAAVASPQPSPTPHYVQCLVDGFENDLGYIACAPLPAMKHFCSDHHAGRFVAFIYGETVAVSCHDADFQWQKNGGWVKVDDFPNGDR
jgi:hypothetical protein